MYLRPFPQSLQSFSCSGSRTPDRRIGRVDRSSEKRRTPYIFGLRMKDVLSGCNNPRNGRPKYQRFNGTAREIYEKTNHPVSAVRDLSRPSVVRASLLLVVSRVNEFGSDTELLCV